jgi:hypothetical protein
MVILAAFILHSSILLKVSTKMGAKVDREKDTMLSAHFGSFAPLGEESDLNSSFQFLAYWPIFDKMYWLAHGRRRFPAAYSRKVKEVRCG